MVHQRFAFLLAAVMLLTACASTGPRTAANSGSEGTPGAKSACPNDTASRIPRDPSSCYGLGRTYSNDELRRTGASSVADALRQLDPAVSVSH